MAQTKAIKTALISVFHKDGLSEILALLAKDGVKFLSTGGTRSFIEQLGYECDAVEDLTGYPSILGGRVKPCIPKFSAASSDVATTKAMLTLWPNLRFLKSIW